MASHAPVCALQLHVRGGLNNQRECILNGVLAARALGVALILPRIDLIGRGNEKFEPTPPPQYDARWPESCTKNCSYPLLFHPPSSVHLVPGIASTSRTIALPAVEAVSSGCTGFPRFRETCAPPIGNTSLLERLLAAWRTVVRSKAPACSSNPSARRHAETPATASKRPASVVLDAGRSLCWNAFQSRDVRACAAVDRACPAILRSLLGSSAALASLEQRVLASLVVAPAALRAPLEASIDRAVGLAAAAAVPEVASPTIPRGSPRGSSDSTSPRAAVSAAADSSGQNWSALHLRAFNCVAASTSASTSARQQPSIQPSRGGTLSLKGTLPAMLERVGVPAGVVYLVSSVPVQQVREALEGTPWHAVGKEDALGDDVRRHHPFEALAALDFGISVRAPVYVGEPGGHSSFDAFVEAQRALDGMPALLPISETHYCAGAPQMDRPQPTAVVPRGTASERTHGSGAEGEAG